MTAPSHRGGPSPTIHRRPMFTLDKAFAECSVTLDKEYSANILSANGFLPSTFFRHSAKNLPSVKKHSANKNNRQIKNHNPPPQKKIAKHFLNYVNNSPTLAITIPIALSFFHYYFESNLYVL
jgi:hypothetical protein